MPTPQNQSIILHIPVSGMHSALTVKRAKIPVMKHIENIQKLYHYTQKSQTDNEIITILQLFTGVKFVFTALMWQKHISYSEF